MQGWDRARDLSSWTIAFLAMRTAVSSRTLYRRMVRGSGDCAVLDRFSRAEAPVPRHALSFRESLQRSPGTGFSLRSQSQSHDMRSLPSETDSIKDSDDSFAPCSRLNSTACHGAPIMPCFKIRSLTDNSMPLSGETVILPECECVCTCVHEGKKQRVHQWGCGEWRDLVVRVISEYRRCERVPQDNGHVSWRRDEPPPHRMYIRSPALFTPGIPRVSCSPPRSAMLLEAVKQRGSVILAHRHTHQFNVAS